ncbi:MAG: hypothetical protein JO018_04475 [Candidatus Eremiobacteraeota bacterium]|nr:hypothetical protein [Candidatus Eremiobacteraeota bacterium]
MKKIRAAIIVSSAALLLAACGGGNKGATGTASTGPMTEGQRESAALPLTQAKPIPGGMNCGATKPVWVNLHTKAYHEPDDPYYGRTKNGQYMCPSAAAAAGYHAAGSGRANMNSANGSSTGNGANGTTSSTTHHRRHHRSSSSY